MEAGSFSIDKADANVEEVNTCKVDYNPLTENCQEFIQQLLSHANKKFYRTQTVGDKVINTLHWINSSVLGHLLIVKGCCIKTSLCIHSKCLAECYGLFSIFRAIWLGRDYTAETWLKIKLSTSNFLTVSYFRGCL